MKSEKSSNLFREVHRLVEERRARMQEQRKDDIQRQQEKAKKEAVREGFDRD